MQAVKSLLAAFGLLVWGGQFANEKRVPISAELSLVPTETELLINQEEELWGLEKGRQETGQLTVEDTLIQVNNRKGEEPSGPKLAFDSKAAASAPQGKSSESWAQMIRTLDPLTTERVRAGCRLCVEYSGLLHLLCCVLVWIKRRLPLKQDCVAQNRPCPGCLQKDERERQRAPGY